ncbi:MAG: hypothetical protein V4481_04000 [Patescibacteria group bacterium]
MQSKPLTAFKKIGPLFTSTHFKDAKDPCVVFDGVGWHIYGSGGSVSKETWQILHATAPDIEGPWKEEEPVALLGIDGPHVAAPSVYFDQVDCLFHMAVQKDFMSIGGSIEYLVSANGKTFTRMSTILDPIGGTSEAGLYDPHFSLIGNSRYMAYSGIPAVMTYDRPFVPQPDVYLAKSDRNLWSGPWQRVRKILDHEQISWHHNKREHPDYEWGIEGPQLVELPDGSILLNATCFIEEGRRGTRQRVFFAHSLTVDGTYTSLGPVLSERDAEWESGENGHATVFIKDTIVYLFYQARSQSNPEPTQNNWHYGLALFRVEDVINAAKVA